MATPKCSVKTAKLQSPIGVGNFVYLLKPSTKFDKEGSYEVTLVFDRNKPEVKAMLDNLAAIFSEVVSWYNAVGVKYKNINEFFSAAGDLAPPTSEGDYVKVKFKSKRPIGVFDAALNPVDKELALYSGSELRVAFQPIPYHIPAQGGVIGLSLRLLQVQVISLSDQTPVFDAVEGGYAQEMSDAEMGEASLEDVGAVLAAEEDPFGV